MKTSRPILSALGIALLATPAFAQKPHRISHHVPSASVTQSAPVTQKDQDGDYVINRSPGAIPSAHWCESHLRPPDRACIEPRGSVPPRLAAPITRIDPAPASPPGPSRYLASCSRFIVIAVIYLQQFVVSKRLALVPFPEDRPQV